MKPQTIKQKPGQELISHMPKEEFKFEVRIPAKNVTTRDRYIGETSGNTVEGGALNADYQCVEALAIVSNRLGQYSLEYGRDFYFSTCGIGEIVLLFKDNKDKFITHLKWI
jgi:hypothetical protein